MHQVVRAERLRIALKTAVAAAVAWAIVIPFGGLADEYPYYAPLGAVVAVTNTILSSAKALVQSVAAILLGGLLAVGVHVVLGQSVLTVAVAVLVGTLLAGWTRLGAMASWVPISALFVLVLGDGTPEDYVLAYAGFTGLGAAVGVGVNMLFPPLPLDNADESLERLRETLARQLDRLAEGLLAEKAIEQEDWKSISDDLDEVGAETRELVQHALEAQQGNWRARRWRRRAEKQYRATLALEQLPILAQDIAAVLVHESQAGEMAPLPAELRPRVAHSLQALSDMLCSVESRGARREEVDELDQAVDRLVQDVRRLREETGEDLFGAGSIVTTLRRARESVQVRSE
jgi:uncharacterized membrane protein YgaE (UPF0421/DUF939 family)